jgi:hypothetical protein
LNSTPNIADRVASAGDDPAAAEAARAERSSDAHDPAAKASWLGLLSFLSDDELARYGEIAKDQEAIEGNLRWLQIASVVVGTCLLVASGLVFSSGASIGLAILLAGVGIAAEVWPYKKAKARKMWAGHAAAVKAEQKRRAAAVES